ncbi:M50 family metallopeptidase [Sinosporangium siamense]|uniref:Zinc metalloprotease n=1 Tax=Sinosporangium siamense TaxID=1367973 RepID=A0A919RM70_9ACTN|nr:site-2 protease family protein [Sinosporangium siamense]GII95757.1 putative zinc metalloprotease [Sinosporangium siamense]
MSWLFVAGIVIFLIGLMLSIALHELGHLVPAKLFGVKVPHFMVGFGPTMWSCRKGETEYGIKWIPFGGYVRMIGMLPPRSNDDPGQLRKVSTGPWQSLNDTAREVSLEDVRPGDEDRVFYRKAWWQKVVIMSGGPAMNFVLAFGLFAIVLMGFGVQVSQPVIDKVNRCVIPANVQARECTAADPLSPAGAAGLRPGDRIVTFDGRKIDSGEGATRAIRAHGAGPAVVGIQRDGRAMDVNVNVIAQVVWSLDESDKFEVAGVLGFTPVKSIQQQSVGAVATHMWDLTARTAQSIVRLPEKMVGVWEAAFSGEERDKNGPIGIIGAGRIGGEIASAPMPLEARIVYLITLLAGFNLAVGVFNLIPLLPLDGGHVAGALWEGLKRGFARVTRRPTPGHVDIAKALPLTYVAAFLMIIMAGLLMYADLVNPVRLLT